MASLKRIPLVECFGPTIQGEGAVIGQQTYFLRFGLCDYKCTMCDSMHAVDPIQVKKFARFITQADIYTTLVETRRPNPYSARTVTFSGGNPCIHDLAELVDILREYRWRIVVETQGTFAPTWLRNTDTITISPKGPGMGENTDLDVLDNFVDQLGPTALHHANIKVVVFDQRDLEFAKMLFERYVMVKKLLIPFYLSLGNSWPPGYASHDPLPQKSISSEVDHEHVERLVTNYKRLWEQIKNDMLLSQMRFLPQWHCIVWGNEKGK